MAVEGQSVELPMAGSTIGFSNHTRKFKTPYVMFADFECLTTKTGCYSKPIKANADDANKPFANKYQKTHPICCLIFLSQLLHTKVYVITEFVSSRPPRSHDIIVLHHAKQLPTHVNTICFGPQKMHIAKHT